MILTDDVYGTFADDFKSLFAICPKNTILVYSFSKYFGETGQYLGFIALTKENALDEKIKALPATAQAELCERYYTLIDLEKTSRVLYGDEFAGWILENKNPIELLFRIAHGASMVLLPGEGFGVQHPSARASLANLNAYQYGTIGASLRKFAEEAYLEFQNLQNQ